MVLDTDFQGCRMGTFWACPTGEGLKEVWPYTQKLLLERVCTLRFIAGENQGKFCELYLLIHWARNKSLKLSRKRTHLMRNYHWSKQERTVQGNSHVFQWKNTSLFSAGQGRGTRSTHWQKPQISSHGEMAGLQLLGMKIQITPNQAGSLTYRRSFLV